MPCAGGLFNFKAGSTAYSLKVLDYDRLPLFAVAQDNRLLNEFAFYCLKRLHKLQNFGALRLTCNDPDGIRAHFAQEYPAVAATGSLPAVPDAYCYSKELIAYMMAMVSTVAYAKTGDTRITGVMDEEYTAALRRFRGMSNLAFNDYIVRRMAAYIERWPVHAKPAAARAPATAPEAGSEAMGGGDAADDDDGFILKASDDDEPAATPPGTQSAGEGGPGA